VLMRVDRLDNRADRRLEPSRAGNSRKRPADGILIGRDRLITNEIKNVALGPDVIVDGSLRQPGRGADLAQRRGVEALPKKHFCCGRDQQLASVLDLSRILDDRDDVSGARHAVLMRGRKIPRASALTASTIKAY